jgi:hypothetical protein
MAACPQCWYDYDVVDTALAEQVTTKVVEFKAVLLFARCCRR